ncbi:MAG TPA: hypothetical protein VEH04_04995 [Verrucomicrobiae bacterium]|nr:hypothetical protein [Verrucomicrobiae bacterium]
MKSNVWCSTEQNTGPRVLLYQSVGFLAIIFLSWLDDWLNLSSLIFGETHFIPEFHASTLAMLFILAVWLLVTRSTRRMLDRVKYLEGFLKVCAWCRRIDHKGRWMPLEGFLQESFDTPTSHGICEECLQQQKAALHRVREQKRTEASAQPVKS